MRLRRKSGLVARHGFQVAQVIVRPRLVVLSKPLASRLQQEVGWEKGLAQTVEWYRVNSDRFGEIEHCLVAHPRAGLGQEEKDE